MKKRYGALVCALAALVSSGVAAQEYPNKPIRLVVGYAPGGFTDVAARLVASDMQKRLGQSIIVENKPGATGTIGADLVSRADPDGYTLLLAHQNSNAVAPALFKNLPYDVNTGFTPIALIANTPLLAVVGPKTQANNIQELIELAKNDSEGLRYGSSGVGSSQHFGAAIFMQETGVNMLHVPYKGSSQSLTDLMSGQIELNFDSPPPTLPLIQAGKLRALAITSNERSPLLPDVPTFAEAGVPGMEYTQWFGLVGPAGLPPEVVEKLNQSLNASLQSPEIRDRLIALGATPLGGSPEEFSNAIKTDSAKFIDLANKLNIAVE